MTTVLDTAATDRPLRRWLRLDAVASGGLGVGALAVAAAGAGPSSLGLPGGLVLGVGGFLAVYAAGLVALAAGRRMWRGGAWVVVIGNVGWVLASIALAIGAWSALTTLGAVVVLAQALAVAVLADLQFTALRRR